MTTELADVEAAVEQLTRSDRGRSTLRRLVTWLDEDGISLDADNQASVFTLLTAAWGSYRGTARDLMREAVEVGVDEPVHHDHHFPASTRELVYYQSRTNPNQLVVFDGSTYHRQDHPSTPLESFDTAEHLEVSRLREHCGPYGNYPWDHWQQCAREDGVPEDLVQLGRSLIREADQHGWSKRLQAECGWQDSGQAMIRLALRHPEAARQRWEYLLRTDGERV